MSQRTQRNRRQLARHIGTLIALYALPVAGLAIYFLSTGLNAEIGRGVRERAGLQQVRRTVTLLHHAVGLAWKNLAANEEAALEFERELVAIEEQDATLATTLPRPAAVAHIGAHAPTLDEIRNLWHKARTAAPGSQEQVEGRHELIHRLNQFIFHASDRAGLTVSPEAETNAMTDIVASLIPLHLERLLHMHERLGPDLRDGVWDPGAIAAAGIFCQQLEAEDVTRIGRSVNAAVAGDLQSAQALDSFQRDYPQEAAEFISGLRRLVSQICPPSGTTAPVLPALRFDDRLQDAFDAALGFWRDSIDHLDRLVEDQVGLARARRDRAVLIAAGFAAILLPLALFYFRTFIRPVVQDMVDEAVEGERQAEEARRAADESRRRLQQTQAALDDHCAVLVIDPSHRILAVNERLCALSGYSREELLRNSPRLIDASALPDESGEVVWSALSAGKIWHGLLKQRTRDGRDYWVDATLFPICDAGGRPVEFVAIQNDITELVRARVTAEDAARAKSRFLAVMSHEIRTPMNGVIGFANLMAETPLDETQRDYLRTILASGESLLVLINDILDFSKLEADRAELEVRPVAIRLLVEDVLELLAAQARAKQLELVYWIEPDVPEGILGDEARLRQILLNLAGNAVKFTATGHVEVVVKMVDADGGTSRNVSFHVIDTGIGIAADRRDRLFQAFSQVDASTTRQFGGTGLGLAISRRLVELMGGGIGVTSEAGRGSDFHFTIPAKPADVSGQLNLRTTVAQAEIEQSLHGRRVLAVDDLPANLRLLEKILARFGAVTVPVHTSEGALGAFAQGGFDLVVLDYMMPGMDGIALAKRLREHGGSKDVPLMLVTSTQPAKTDTPAGLFAAVVPKPLRNLQFSAAAAQAIRGRTHRQPETSAPADGAAAKFATTHPLRVLVADDNPVNLKVISATLRSLGYEPAAFNSATAALERLERERFDLILMDVQMPDLDGLEATKRLRAGTAGELNRRTRIVALTAGALAEERAACLTAGMDDFLAKPVPRALLLEKLTEAAAVAV